MKMRSLGRETFLYFAVYILYLLYGLYNLLSVREQILKLENCNFPQGWFANSRRDDSNDELENFNTYLQHWWIWYIIHLVTSYIFSRFWPRKRSLGYAIVCILALLCSVKFLFVLFFSCQLLSYYAISIMPSKAQAWTVSALWMIIINVIKNSAVCYELLGYTEYFLLILTLSWSLLRCCSFVLSKTNKVAAGTKNLEELYSFEMFFGYTLYFPCMVHGPFLSYDRYISKNTFSIEYESESKNYKINALLLDLVRVFFWWLILNISLHFLYIHYMARDIEAVKLVTPTFGQHAVGYFMGQFFFLYYVVTYGLGIAFAKYDNLNPPNPPRCIGCIHSYADMWKYFDEGLYEFLFKNIYAELCCKNSHLLVKLIATAATFTFIFVWHGCYNYVLIWSVLNFICLVAEKCFKAMVSSKKYQDWSLSTLGARNSQRLYAFLGTQLFIPSAFSNVYFISGMQVGNYLMRGAYRSGILNFMALTFCSYCFFQCVEIIYQRRKFGNKTLEKLT